MGASVRQVVGPAENMTDLVVQSHSDGPHHPASQPRAVEGAGTSVEITRCNDDPRQRVGQGADPFLGEHSRDR
jgi:hypothetical protein